MPDLNVEGNGNGIPIHWTCGPFPYNSECGLLKKLILKKLIGTLDSLYGGTEDTQHFV